jgi:hypothetical protein
MRTSIGLSYAAGGGLGTALVPARPLRLHRILHRLDRTSLRLAHLLDHLCIRFRLYAGRGNREDSEINTGFVHRLQPQLIVGRRDLMKGSVGIAVTQVLGAEVKAAGAMRKIALEAKKP